MARYLSRADLSRIAGKYIDQYYTRFGISKDAPEPIDPERLASAVLGLNVKMLPLCSDGSVLGLTVFQRCGFTVTLGDLLEEMRRKDLDAAKKETTRWKEEVQTKVDEQDALKKEMIRVIQGTSGLDREMIQQMVNENKEALLTAQTNLADSEKKLKEIEEQNQKAERNCSDLFTWASTYKGASFERRQAILKQFIKEVRVGRDYNIEIVLNVPLDEFEEFKRHAASAGRGKNQKNKSQNPQKVGRCTSNAGIVVLDKTAGETVSIVPKNAAHAILRC